MKLLPLLLAAVASALDPSSIIDSIITSLMQKLQKEDKDDDDADKPSPHEMIENDEELRSLKAQLKDQSALDALNDKLDELGNERKGASSDAGVANKLARLERQNETLLHELKDTQDTLKDLEQLRKTALQQMEEKEKSDVTRDEELDIQIVFPTLDAEKAAVAEKKESAPHEAADAEKAKSAAQEKPEVLPPPISVFTWKDLAHMDPLSFAREATILLASSPDDEYVMLHKNAAVLSKRERLYKLISYYKSFKMLFDYEMITLESELRSRGLGAVADVIHDAENVHLRAFIHSLYESDQKALVEEEQKKEKEKEKEAEARTSTTPPPQTTASTQPASTEPSKLSKVFEFGKRALSNEKIGEKLLNRLNFSGTGGEAQKVPEGYPGYKGGS